MTYFEKPYYGYDFVTSQLVLFLKNNQKNNLLEITPIWWPDSIEYNEVKDRDIHASYLPGILVKIKFLADLFKINIDYQLVKLVGLVNSYFISLFISLVIFFLYLRENYSFLFIIIISLFSSILILFSRGLFFYFQHVLTYEIDSFLYISLIILLEFCYNIFSNLLSKRIFNFIYLVTIFFALITDWFSSIFIFFIIFYKSIIYLFLRDKNIFNQIKQIIFVFIFFLIFLTLYELRIEGIFELYERFKIRSSGIDDNGFLIKGYFRNIFLYFKNIFGDYSLIFSIVLFLAITFFSLTLYFKKRKEKKICFFIYCFIVVNLLSSSIYNFFLKNASFIHEFFTIKFFPTFVFLPTLTPFFIGKVIKSKKIIYFITAAILFLYLLNLYISDIYYYYKKNNRQNYIYSIFGNFLKENANYNDVIYSSDYVIGVIPPQLISITLKRIYYLENTDLFCHLYKENKKVNGKITFKFLIFEQQKLPYCLDTNYRINKICQEVNLNVGKKLKKEFIEELRLYYYFKQITKNDFKKLENKLNNLNSINKICIISIK